MTTSSPDEPVQTGGLWRRSATPGLRERKKARTRASIQDHALRLILRQGWQATTVEQIAEAAEVSPSTFFRYFATKAEVIITDQWDPVIIENFRAQPASLSCLSALRRALDETFGDLTAEETQLHSARAALILDEPDLRQAFVESLAGMTDLFTEVIAARAGRPATDPEAMTLVGAVLGIFLTVLMHDPQPVDEQLRRILRALAQLEAGFTI